MNEPPSKPPAGETDPTAAAVRTKQVTVAGWTAGVPAFIALVTHGETSTWPAAFALASVMAMVAVVCCLILRRDR